MTRRLYTVRADLDVEDRRSVVTALVAPVLERSYRFSVDLYSDTARSDMRDPVADSLELLRALAYDTYLDRGASDPYMGVDFAGQDDPGLLAPLEHFVPYSIHVEARDEDRRKLLLVHDGSVVVQVGLDPALFSALGIESALVPVPPRWLPLQWGASGP